MPIDPALVIAIVSVLTAFAGWIRGRTVGRKQGYRVGVSLRPPSRYPVHCEHCGKQNHTGKDA